MVESISRRMTPDIRKKLPHNSRLDYRIAYLLFLIIVIVLSLLSMWNLSHNNSNLVQQKKKILIEPKISQGYMALGESLENRHQYTIAELQYQLAKQQGSSEADKAIERIQTIRQAPWAIRQGILQWAAFVQAHPQYADGWLAIALLAYQINDKEVARQALGHVFLINPQSEPAKQLEKSL